MNTTQNCVSACNKLLRGELSAIETYQQALKRFADSPHRSTLEEILGNHSAHVDSLRIHIYEMGGEPDTDSGIWGDFATAVEGAATLLGDSPAIDMLMRGEAHGISEYEEALENPEVMDEAKAMYRDSMIPQLNKHIAMLEGIPA